MVPVTTIKQGALLSISLAFQQDDGTPIDMTGAVITSQIRDGLGNLIATPTITPTALQLGQLSYTAQTDATWPTPYVRSDIYVSLNDVPTYSDTFFISVTAPVTAAPAAPPAQVPA